ncbi:MAG: GDSL-type esterase/lipase family protein [Candidatus Solibacter sp.]
MRDFPLHTALSIATLGVVLALVRPPGAAMLRGLVDFTPELTPWSPLTRHVAVTPDAVRVTAPVTRKLAAARSDVGGPLLDDSDGVLDGFYAALHRTENREAAAVTRIVHYGDSPTTADLITGDLRSLLQARFGNAGHGFIFPDKPWAWYQHSGVTIEAKGWQNVPASRFEARDGLFGLGGVSFTGGAGAVSTIDFGKGRYTQFEVWFLRQANGGSLTVSAGGTKLGQVDTAGEGTVADFAAFTAAEPASSLSLRVTGGHVRVFGVTAESAGPGLVYDSLGLNGASITVLSRMLNQEHWAGQLQHRRPDLVVLNYGTNEADFAEFVEKGYEKELREAIRRLHAALPGTAVLIMSPIDRGHKAESGEIETMATIPKIVALQRRVARETACGFFDTFHAMGGEGTMALWYAAQPRLVSADFIHPNPGGGKIVASIFAREIGAGLNRYRLEHVPVEHVPGGAH